MRQFALGVPVLTVWVAITLLASVAVCVLVWRIRQLRADLTAAVARRDAAVAAAAANERLLRLATNDFRAPALALLSHAQQLRCGPPDAARHGGAVAAIAEQLLGVVDMVQDHALPGSQPPKLRMEKLSLGAALADAMAAANGALEPGRRRWRVAPDVEGRQLLADRRALHQILLRVLTNAIRLSRQDDWIDIAGVAASCGFTLIVADEGNGLAGLDPPGFGDLPDNRGMGLGLSLARSLMAAHGGTLTVESTSHVGARVLLYFPAEVTAAKDMLVDA